MRFSSVIFCSLIFSTLPLTHTKACDEHDKHKAQPLASASATLMDKEQKELGTLSLRETPNGILAQITAEHLPTGWHGIHIHAHGLCAQGDFTDAGAHASQQPHNDHQHITAHGFLVKDGYHTGDMPNIWVHKDGTARVDFFLPHQTLATFLDEDGAAIILHAQQDDYHSQPAGNAGARIACGVLNKR
ncbi:MAG: superoxide dismutase family protein [Alphaproteobacteria bacterium]|nr:MAG: superoxide dismutase family protein [Alphaproteobacteria bacterium]